MPGDGNYDANGNILYADTDKLDPATFWAYGTELQRTIDKLKSEIDACLPIAVEERGQSDTEINKSVGNACKYIQFLLSELRDLSHGDADQVAFLSKMIKDVEEINNQVATFDGTGKH
jgi:hypothetical protein